MKKKSLVNDKNWCIKRIISKEKKSKQATKRYILLLNYVISSAVKLIIFGMKFSLIIIPRSTFQSVVDSPNNRHIDSNTFLIIDGGLDIVRISTKCCRLIDFTPVD